jgi:hypothetical protein
MKGDFTRNTFKRERHYSSVRMQQGRVQLDADWNEQLDINAHRDRTTRRDVIGCCGGPKGKDKKGNDLAGFGITPSGTNLNISKGRYYVHGILCENEADVLLTQQEHLPGFDPLAQIEKDPGIYLAYLDVWERHITALDDREIREVALGGPDTATRTQVIWQVKVEKVGKQGGSVECGTIAPGWAPSGALSTGRLAARAEPDPKDERPCVVPPKAGYRRLENQLYRVEIHEGGGIDAATFKWSRENGSVVTLWDDQDGDNLTVSSPGRDRVLGFTAGDWIELTDDTRELRSSPGVMARLVKVDGNVFTIDPATIQDPDDPNATNVDRTRFPRNPKIRRWESEGAQSVTVPPANQGWIMLEDGVEIKFQTGTFRSGDYWLIPARTALADVLWPVESPGGKPLFQPPHGIEHHYCKLALVIWTGEDKDFHAELDEDCRQFFDPLVDLQCGDEISCPTIVVGDGVHSTGHFNGAEGIVQALKSLAKRKTGGTICIREGTYRFKNRQSLGLENLSDVTIRGAGPATRIYLENRPGAERPVTITGCQRLKIEGLAILSVQGQDLVAVKACRDIAIRNCLLYGLSLTKADARCLLVAETTGLQIEGSEITGRNGIGFAGARQEAASSNITARGNRFFVEGCGVETQPSAVLPPVAMLALDGNRFSPFSVDANVDPSMMRKEFQSPQSARMTAVRILASCCRIADNHLSGTCSKDDVPSLPAEIWKGMITEEIVKMLRESAGSDSSRKDVPHLIHLLGGSSDVLIEGNCIRNARGNGICLGSVDLQGVPESRLDGVHIRKNLILRAGLNGIGAERFLASSKDEQPLLTSDNLVIEGNLIRDCANQAPVIEKELLQVKGYGGIALADGERITIRDNEIRDNGAENDQAPVTGIFIYHGVGIEISGNRIEGNGKDIPIDLLDLGADQRKGYRGGIVIPYSTALFDFTTDLFQPLETLALTVSDNTVISTSGPALTVACNGKVLISHNTFYSEGMNTAGPYLITSAGATVTVIHLGSNILGLMVMMLLLLETIRLLMGLSDTNAGEGSAEGSLVGIAETLFRLADHLNCDGVTFEGNRCNLELGNKKWEFVFSSVVLLSFSDLLYHGNQSFIRTLADMYFLNGMFFSLTHVITDNSFREGYGFMELAAMLRDQGKGGSPKISYLTLGAQAAVANNNSTNCYLCLALPNRRKVANNVMTSRACEAFENVTFGGD